MRNIIAPNKISATNCILLPLQHNVFYFRFVHRRSDEYWKVKASSLFSLVIVKSSKSVLNDGNKIKVVQYSKLGLQ